MATDNRISPKKYVVKLIDQLQATVAVAQVEAFDPNYAKAKAILVFAKARITQTSFHSYEVVEVAEFRILQVQLTLFGDSPKRDIRQAPCSFRLTAGTYECNDCLDEDCPYSPKFKR